MSGGLRKKIGLITTAGSVFANEVARRLAENDMGEVEIVDISEMGKEDVVKLNEVFKFEKYPKYDPPTLASINEKVKVTCEKHHEYVKDGGTWKCRHCPKKL